MPVEEGLVIPTFALDPEADEAVLPAFTPPVANPTPSPAPAATPTRFDPEGRGPRQGMGFLENVLGAFGSGTIEGALNEAEALRLARGGSPLPEATAIDQGSGFVPPLDEGQAKALRDQARDAVFDQIAYDLAPTRITPRSVAGTVVGQALSPLNLAGFGGETIAAGLAQRGFGETAQAAARFGAQASGTSAAVTDIRRASGARDEGGLTDQLLAGVAGSVLGAGTHVAGAALGRAAGRLGEFVRGRQAQREALGTDLPREALGAREADATSPIGAAPEAQPSATPRGDLPAEPVREAEPAQRIPPAEPDPTAPVSREQADGRAEPAPPVAGEGQPAAIPDQAAAAAPAEPFEARASRFSAERAAMEASGADAAPETRDLHEALGSAESAQNADPAAASHHIDQALKLGRTDIADHIVEGAERGAVEAERAAADAAAARDAQDTAGTRYAAAVALEDAQRARDAATAARRQRGAPAAPDRGTLDERSSNADPSGVVLEGAHLAERIRSEPVPAERSTYRLSRQNFDPEAPPKAAGELDRRGYTIEKDGQEIGHLAVAIRGDTADIRDIYAPRLGSTDARGMLGPRATSALLRQFLDENPQITRLTGERVSGARRGGEHGFQGTGERVEVPIPAGRRGRAAVDRPRDLIGQPVPGLGEHRVSVPGGEPIQVAPVVLEASDLRTSADPGYDRTLQPRQRERAASQEQIRDIASNLEPARLGVSAEADRGAPIVGGDAMVESGNGRVLAIRRAYEQGGEAADRYRAWLADQGVDVGRYRQPVLVRQRLTGFTAEERRAFTDAANRPAGLSMSAPERAMADARLVTPDSLDLIRNANDLGAATNRDFVRTFVARLPQAERGAMTTAEGGLSAEGAARVRNAVLAKAYDHAGVLSRIAEATSDDVRSISNALVAAAPEWAKLRADIGRGAVRADVDLTGELLEAVARTADLRAKGQKLDTFLDQQDAFDRLPRPVEAFMRMFYDERGRRAASGPVVAERLKTYAGEARKVLADQGLDLGMPSVSAEEIQAAAARRGQRAPAGEPALLFSRRQPTDPRQVSFFDRVAESLRSAEPGGGSKRAGDAADFLRGLGTEMADRAGREGPQAGSVLDRLSPASAERERPLTLAQEIEAQIREAQARPAEASAAADEPFTAQLAREMRAETDQVARTQRERPDLLDSAETSVVEAATRLHGTPAERRIPIDELRASVPDLSTGEFERAVVDLHGRGVARVTDGAVSLDQAGVRAAQETVERHVRTEAESIGRELFGERPEVLHRRRAAAAQTVEEPDQIRQGRPVEDQGTAPVEGDVRPARLEEMAQRLAADFETVLRTGRVQPGARGQFNTQTGVARVRSLADLDTALHEIGHSLQQSPETGRLVDPIIARNRAELAPLGAGTGATGDAEAFAELMRLYGTNRAYAERTYPGATADLARTLAADLPAQAAALDRLRTELDALYRAPSGAVVGADVITPKPDGIFRRIFSLLGGDFVGAPAADPRGGVYYGWRDALYTHFLSPHHPLNRATDVLARVSRENTGKTLDLLPQDNPYILARISSGARSIADTMLEHGVRGFRSDAPSGPSFRDAIETAIGKRYSSQQWHDFGAYLTAKSMVEDFERFAAGEIPNPPGKLSAGDYAKAVDEFETKFPSFVDGAQKFYEFNTNLTQRQFDRGLFSKEYMDAAAKRKFYAPKMRDMEDLGSPPLTGGGGGRDGASMMKTFRGSQRSVINPLDSTVKKVHDLELAGALNDTKVALAQLAEIAGPGSGFIAEHIPANRLSAVTVDVVDALRAAGSRANVDNLDLGALIHQAEGLLGDDVFAHIFRQEPIRPGREPITFYWVNGERRALRLGDDAFGRELYGALNKMTQPERNIFLSVLQISGQVLRSGVTKSVGFVYRNFTRDQGTSVATGARGYLPYYSALKGGFDVVRRGGDFEKYLSFGGFGGGAITESIEASQLARGGAQRMFREKNVVSRALGAGAKLAELSEAATRAGQFTAYLKQAEGMGFDAYNAALYASFKANDYIDFRKVGSHVAAVARVIPFLNASAQGTDREARGLIGDMVRLETKRARGEELTRIEADTLKDARVAWLKTLGWGMLFGAGPAYLNSDKPEWSGASEWRKQRGYNIVPFGPAGHWLTSFKPFGLVRNISDLFQYGTEYMMRGDPTLGGKLARALAEAHSLPYTNPVVDTFYGARANYDAFRDRPIVSPSLQALAPADQYNRYTSEIAKWMGQATGWSPMKIDYVVKNMGGGMAQDFLANSTTLIKWMEGRPGGKEKTIWDLPLMRELTQNLAVGNEATTRFYGLVGQKVGTLEQAANGYGQKIATGDRTGAESYLRNLPANERAYAVLMKTTFDAEDRLMHPLALARAYNAVIGGVSKALGDGNLLPEGDLDRQHITQSRRDGKPIFTDGPTTEKLRNELDAYSMVTARNALIAYGAPGMEGVPVKDPGEFLDRIKLLSPDVARELRGRLAAKRLYDPAVVAERWPEVKARLLKDGEDANFNDLLPHRPKSAKRERMRALTDD